MSIEETPSLTANISLSEEPTVDTWLDATLSVRNVGLAPASNITVIVTGIETEGIPSIPLLPTDGIEILRIRVRLKNAGTNPFELSMKCLRILDGREFVFNEKRDIHVPVVEAPKEKQWYRRFAATTPMKCGICRNIIKLGMTVIRCECRTPYHEDCTTPILKCPVCKRSFDGLPLKKRMTAEKEAGLERIETLRG